MPETEFYTDVPVLGADAKPREIRRLLNRIDLHDCRTPDGRFYSPITGEIFDTLFQLSGHVGAKLRSRELTPLGDARADYVKAKRRGEEPSEEAKEAHRKYQRALRARRKAERLAAEKAQAAEDGLLSPPE